LNPRVRAALAREMSAPDSDALFTAVMTTMATAINGMVASAEGVNPSTVGRWPPTRKFVRYLIRAGTATAVTALTASRTTANTNARRCPRV
jgi:hypothetical protein